MSAKEFSFFWGGGVFGKFRPAREADTSAVLVVPNIKTRLEAQYSFPLLNLYDLLGKPLPLPATTVSS